MDFEQYAEQAAAAVALPLAPEHRAGVVVYLRLAAAMAAQVEGLALGREDEGANVFMPVGPEDLPGPEAAR